MRGRYVGYKMGHVVLKVSDVYRSRVTRVVGCIAGAVLFMQGCATPPPASDKEATAAYNETNDPYEPFNRAMLEFNLALDKAVLKPVTFLYKEGVPEPFRINIHNFLSNLRGPVTLANDLLQGEWDRAGNTFMRFTMNSSLGILGINDIAAEAGMPKHEEDFGQTLATWDVDSGPYLVLPLFGPSNPRDAVGLVADWLIDPFGYTTPFEFRAGVFVGNAVDTRARRYDAINDLEKNSLDFYAALRSLYRQRRMDEIRNGAPSANTPTPGGLSGTPSKKPSESQQGSN